MFVEMTMRERKVVCRHSKTKKNTRTKMTDKATKETYEKHFASCSGL